MNIFSLPVRSNIFLNGEISFNCVLLNRAVCEGYNNVVICYHFHDCGAIRGRENRLDATVIRSCWIKEKADKKQNASAQPLLMNCWPLKNGQANLLETLRYVWEKLNWEYGRSRRSNRHDLRHRSQRNVRLHAWTWRATAASFYFRRRTTLCWRCLINLWLHSVCRFGCASGRTRTPQTIISDTKTFKLAYLGWE